MEALQQPTIRVIAVIAEGVPEADTKQLIAYAAQHNKIVLGPATVGGLQVLLNKPLSKRRVTLLDITPILQCHQIRDFLLQTLSAIKTSSCASIKTADGEPQVLTT